MLSDTFSIRKFLVTISQTAYLEQAPMTLHFIDCFSHYWRYINQPPTNVYIKEELDVLIMLREIFFSIPFFHLLDTDISAIPEEIMIRRAFLFEHLWEHIEQLSNDSYSCTSLHFTWNKPEGQLKLTGMFVDGTTADIYTFTS